MSLTRIVDVICNECGQMLDQSCYTGSEARAAARFDGWRTGLPGGRDLCPDCR